MEKKYPFKFLNSYEKEDSNIFFGRDEEINMLYEMVFQSAVILIYGASGTGKTSIINCGLAGKFQPHDWLPLMIRRGNNINDALEKALVDAGGNPNSLKDDINWLDDWSDETENTSLSISSVGQTIKSLYQKSFRPVYLIFDQFEELFIIGSIKEQELFIKTVKDILESQQPVKLIFSIREEYLGYLFEFEQAVPQLMHKKLRIEAMNLEKVRQVVNGISKLEDSNVKIKDGQQEEVTKGIFEKVKGKTKSLTIQLPFLNVFLDKFYTEITKDVTRKSEAVFSVEALHEMGEIGDVLVDFLNEQVEAISKNLTKKHPDLTSEAVWQILSPFSTLEGTKEPINIKNLHARLNNLDNAKIDAVIDALINSRIVRYNESNDTFEIAHDSLAKPIAEKRSIEEKAILEINRMIKGQVGVKEEVREYFTEKQLVFIEPYLNKFMPGYEEQDWINKSRNFVNTQKALATKKQLADLNKKRRQQILTISVVVLVLFISFFIFLALKARKQEIIAQNEKIRAEKAEDYNQELLRQELKGRGEQYNDLSDSEILDVVHREQNYPIDSLIFPKASVGRSDRGEKKINYTLWIEVPSYRKLEIKEVQYFLCQNDKDIVKVSAEPSSNFAVGYLGDYCSIVKVDIILNNGDIIKRNISYIEYLSTNTLK